MKIRMKLNLGSSEFPDHPYLEGVTYDAEEALAEKLIARGLADSDEPAKLANIKGVTPPQEIFEPESKTIAGVVEAPIEHETKQAAKQPGTTHKGK